MDEQPFFILLFDLIIIPPFQHSNLPALRSLRAQRFNSFLHPRRMPISYAKINPKFEYRNAKQYLNPNLKTGYTAVRPYKNPVRDFGI